MTAGAGHAPAAADAPVPVLTAWDLKQWQYCPRVVFWTLCAPVRKYVPPNVVLGTEAHALVEGLERRRGVRRYGFGRAAKRFEVRCRSDRLGLSGTADMVLDDGRRMAPVEFKMTRHGPRPNVRLQIAAYAVMLEETCARRVTRGFLVEIPHMAVHVVDIGEAERAAVAQCAGAIRAMLAAESLPPPTPDRGKCVDCELLPYCGDVG